MNLWKSTPPPHKKRKIEIRDFRLYVKNAILIFPEKKKSKVSELK